jgi:hypothetical protein
MTVLIKVLLDVIMSVIYIFEVTEIKKKTFTFWKDLIFSLLLRIPNRIA